MLTTDGWQSVHAFCQPFLLRGLAGRPELPVSARRIDWLLSTISACHNDAVM